MYTALPTLLLDTENKEPIFLSDMLSQQLSDELHPLSEMVLALSIVAYADQHHRSTSANVARTGALEYNFCHNHEKIEIMINSILTHLSATALLTGPYHELRVLAFIITLGARITLYNTVVVNVQKATFLGPVAGESRKVGIAAANAIAEALIQADVLDTKQVRA